jgi:hypothetical protein
MHGKAAQWTFERIVECEMVEEQEWIVLIAGARSKTPAPSRAS